MISNTIRPLRRLACYLVLPAVWFVSTNAQEARMRNMLVINEDNSHFFGTRRPEQMNLAGLHAFVDQYADSAVTHLFLCPNAMRASFRSTSRDAIWDPVDGKEPTGRWPRNAKRLYDRGLDPYAVWIERCRERGISPWLSVRMNDVHDVGNADSFMHSTFWRNHPECWRVPNGNAAPWQNRAMNYAHKAVRDHHLAFVRELLERYDPDGIELDWMRFGYHLTPGKAKQEGPILTQFVRDVRQLVDQWSAERGHRIRLGVRVPTHPDAAAGLGMDGVLWAREGLIDLLAPCPFWSSSDFDIPVETWLGRLGDDAVARVTVAPGVEYNARPWPGGTPVANTLATLYGFAASARQRGADSLYLFNWMDSGTRPVAASRYRKLVEKGLTEAVLTQARRRHPLGYRDTVPPGFPSGAQLPVESLKGGEFRIHIGPVPSRGTASLVAGLAKRNAVEAAAFGAVLNGVPLGPAAELEDLTGLGGGASRAIAFDYPLATLRPGYNDIALRQKEGTPGQQIVWVELRLDPGEQ